MKSDARLIGAALFTLILGCHGTPVDNEKSSPSPVEESTDSSDAEGASLDCASLDEMVCVSDPSLCWWDPGVSMCFPAGTTNASAVDCMSFTEAECQAASNDCWWDSVQSACFSGSQPDYSDECAPLGEAECSRDPSRCWWDPGISRCFSAGTTNSPDDNGVSDGYTPAECNDLSAIDSCLAAGCGWNFEDNVCVLCRLHGSDAGQCVDRGCRWLGVGDPAGACVPTTSFEVCGDIIDDEACAAVGCTWDRSSNVCRTQTSTSEAFGGSAALLPPALPSHCAKM